MQHNTHTSQSPHQRMSLGPIATKLKHFFQSPSISPREHRIVIELHNVGIDHYQRLGPEGQVLFALLRPNEHIGGVLYGHHETGTALMVATNQRLMFIDKKPFFLKIDEIGYESLHAVNYETIGFLATVTLLSSGQDYRMRTNHLKSAQEFVQYVELKSLEQPGS